MDHEREKWEWKQQQMNWQVSFHFLFNLGSEDMPIQEYVQLVRRGNVDVEFQMVELVAWVEKFIRV